MGWDREHYVMYERKNLTHAKYLHTNDDGMVSSDSNVLNDN